MQHSQGMLLSVLGSVDISRHSRESGNLFPLGSVIRSTMSDLDSRFRENDDLSGAP